MLTTEDGVFPPFRYSNHRRCHHCTGKERGEGEAVVAPHWRKNVGNRKRERKVFFFCHTDFVVFNLFSTRTQAVEDGSPNSSPRRHQSLQQLTALRRATSQRSSFPQAMGTLQRRPLLSLLCLSLRQPFLCVEH